MITQTDSSPLQFRNILSFTALPLYTSMLALGQALGSQRWSKGTHNLVKERSLKWPINLQGAWSLGGRSGRWQGTLWTLYTRRRCQVNSGAKLQSDRYLWPAGVAALLCYFTAHCLVTDQLSQCYFKCYIVNQVFLSLKRCSLNCLLL